MNDHESLKNLETQQKLSRGQARWLELLNQYPFRLVVVREKHNAVSDALSRQGHTPLSTKKYDHHLLQRLIEKTEPLYLSSLLTTDLPKAMLYELRKEYPVDPEFSDVFQIHDNPLEIQNGLLFKSGKLCQPKGRTRNKILHDHHHIPSEGRMGVDKTIPLLSESYF